MEDTVLTLTEGAGVFQLFRKIIRASRQRWDGLDDETRRFAAVCKACFPGCDVAGSARLRSGHDTDLIQDWIRSAFGSVPKAREIREIVTIRLDGCLLRAFQKQAGESTARVTFLRAGCGSGKTLAAYHWAAERCPAKRLYVCYPTTGTATEGYRDYLFDCDSSTRRFGAALFHSRAQVDVEIILGAEDDPECTEDALRLDALDSWSTPIVSCTVDTVLSVMQNGRRGLYSWPAFAGAAFVFDEIHAYDDRMFGTLLRFLRDVRGVPVLLMTASLPTSRLVAIRDCLKAIDEPLETIPGPAELEQLPRYHRLMPAQPDDPLPEIHDALDQGANVLWICNTVGRAIDYARHAADRGLGPLIYHSRFRYEDRVDRHREVMDAFRARQGVLAVCTQVAEVSLDISADLLVTDLAPAAALIQRMGRLNRKARPPQPGQLSPATKPFIVIEPNTPMPYATPDNPTPLRPARKWLDSLGGDLSQADLADAWEQLDSASVVRPTPSAWLDGGPETRVLELREGAFGVTVVMAADAEAVRTGHTRLARVALPMPRPPRGLPWRSWQRIRGCPVAPAGSINYDRKRGAQWQGK